MKSFPLAFCALALLAPTLTACDSGDADETIAELVINDRNLTTLEAALVRAELDGALDGDGPFTVFAPTDEAFERLLDDLDATPAELLDRDDLAEILQLHVVSGRALESDDLDDGTVIATLNGRSIRIADGGIDADNDGEADAEFDRTDIEASNGIVHKIDRVLL